jgi:L-ascorbate metabolism protein UlaG (beta-lactamase superfamily)
MSRNTKVNGLTVEWLGHSSVGIYGKKVIYVDLFSEVLRGDEKKGDLIISTHDHRDHLDMNAINKLSKDSTSIVIKSGSSKDNLSSTHIKELGINEKLSIGEVEIKSVHAYNTKRFRSPGTPFHPEGFGMGVVIFVEGVKLYYAGDSDFIPPMAELKDERIDVAFLPIGGTYTMDIDEAVEAALVMKPRIVIPVHYNHIKGTEADPMEFKRKLEDRSESKAIIL